MQIRPYQKSDKPSVIALWKNCNLVVPHNDPEKDIERKLKVDPDLFLVGLADNRIVASVMGGYDGHRGWINYLAVDTETQKRGLGRQMMRTVERLLREKGCPKINLQVRGSNRDIIDFYQAIGYSIDNVVSLGMRLEEDN